MCWDNGNYIYAVSGGSYKDSAARSRHQFWRYDIADNSWENLPDTPMWQGPGDALVWVKLGEDEYIYAWLGTTSYGVIQSGGTDPEAELWRFNISTNSWDQLLRHVDGYTTNGGTASAAQKENGIGADDGTNLVWTGGDYIYYTPGAYNEGLPKDEERYFMRYSISTNTLVEMAKAPYHADGGFDDGGSLVYPGSGDYIYVLKGGDDLAGGGGSPGINFWRYSISDNSWENLPDLPVGIGEQNGCRLGYAGGNLYYWVGPNNNYPTLPLRNLYVYGLEGPGVDVSISPTSKSGLPGSTLTYTVNVKNTGTENDNYELENTDTKGWALELSKSLLENITPGASENVTLTVIIPESAEYCAEDLIKVTATSLMDSRVSDNANCIAHQGYFGKENMPDLGQHCENWCWAAAAANSIWWYANHGYPQLIDNLENAESDNEWIDQWYTCPTCGQYRKLLAVIASYCLGLPPEDTWCHSVNDVQYFDGLREFMENQGAPLAVHEIVDPTHFAPENIPPPSENVVYAQPTFDNYRKQLLRCQDVLLWLDLDYEPTDHVVTGVSFFENQWIEVSDPWSTGMPDHNNDNENRQYDNCAVISEVPFRITVPSYGQPATVVKMVYISPIPWTGWATFKLENLYKVSLEKDLQLYTGSKLVVKFYKYDNTTFQAESVIDNWITTPKQVKENENVPHPSGLPVQIATLVLTTDDTANEIRPTIASFTVTKPILSARYSKVKRDYSFAPPGVKPGFSAEYGAVKRAYNFAPS